MAGSINEFKSSFTKDLARSSRFDVNINIPLAMIPYLNSAKKLNYRCDSANLPGRTLGTTEQKTYGPIEKYPYMTTYNDMSLTFIVDDDMSQKVFFDAWMSYINPLYNNNYRYKGDYATTIIVNQYNVSGEKTYSINLNGAYPISINQMDLNWNDDSYHKLSVTFAYTYWQNNSLQALGMELVDAGINAVTSAVGGLDGGSSGIVDQTKNGLLSGF